MKFFSAVVLSCISSFALAQVSATQAPDIHTGFAELANVSSIDRADLKPWHLQMSFELYDLSGKHQENGTIEEWWVAPGKFRLQIASPSFKQTIPGTADAASDSSRESYLVHRLLDEVVHPVPNFGAFDQLKVSEAKRTIGKIPLSCLLVTKAADRSHVGDSSNPEFCTDTASGELRAIFDTGEFVGIRNRIGHFQEVTVALDDTLSYAGKLAIAGHTTLLQMYSPEESPVELTSVAPSESQIPEIVLVRTRTKFVQPVYPPDAKAAHRSGEVVLCILVGQDGKSAGLHVASTTDQMFDAAALDAVRQWQYQPYLLNGKPISVESTVTVNFSLTAN